MPSLVPIRVAPGGCYFETFDGDPFLFLGPNDAITWPGLAGLYRRRDLDAVDAYLAGLADNGVTILRLMLEYAHRDHRYFEQPRAGRFNPALVQLWDDLFACCERHGLRVLLTPWDNFWMARRWKHHPYNQANGGPAHAPADFFTNPTVIEATIHRFRFVIERWGGGGVLAAWDLFNEIHPYWGGTPHEQGRVIEQVSNAVRTIEQKTWGWTRPQTVSVFGPDPAAQGYGDLIFTHPCLDFVTTHVYQGAIDHPEDTVTPALAMARWVRHARRQIPPGRPFTDTEHGPIHLFNDHHKRLPDLFDDEYERHLMWAHLASGGAGSGMRWPARHPHMLTGGMKRALASVAGFAELVDWRHFAPRAANADVSVDAPGVHVFACGDAHQAVVWLLRPKPGPSHKGPLPPPSGPPNVTLTLRGFLSGAYCATPWQTDEGRARACIHGQVSAKGELQIPLSDLPNDLALALRLCP